MTASFNLITDPWIAVRAPGGEVHELSIRDVFHRADEFQGLAGEIPTQEVAVFKLLLAIMYRTTARKRTQDDTLTDWSEWWESGKLPLTELDAYLDRYADRFDLFHPEFPFMQVSSLHTAKGGASGLEKLIAEVPAGHKFFTTRDRAGIEILSYAEAARWLVHAHAFDPSGIKSGAVGDERVRGGKGYPIGIGVSGWFGTVIAEGATLRETLLLNLVLSTDPSSDTTPWEREPHTAADDWMHSAPRGTADLYTWQTRRIRLFEGGGVVHDVLLANGDRLGPQNLHNLEPLSAWRFSEPQTKKLGHPTYMPRSHDNSRAMWRGLEPMLTKAALGGKSLRPGLIDRIADLRLNGFLPTDQMIRLRAVGIEYGSQSAVISATVDDSLPVSVAVLGDEFLALAAIRAADVAQECVIILANLASDLAHAAGTDPDIGRAYAFELGFSTLDPLFRRWFAGLRADSHPDDIAATWQLVLRRSLTYAGAQLCRDAGEGALTGRLKSIKSGSAELERVFDTAQSWHKFARALRKATPAADPDSGSSGGEGNSTDESTREENT